MVVVVVVVVVEVDVVEGVVVIGVVVEAVVVVVLVVVVATSHGVTKGTPFHRVIQILKSVLRQSKRFFMLTNRRFLLC